MIECPVDDLIPLQTGKSASHLDYHQVRQKAAAACNTAFLLDSEGYEGPHLSVEDLQMEAHKVLIGAVSAKGAESTILNAAISTPEGALYVNSLLTHYDMEVVQDAKRLRNYVTNKLIIESENMDARIRIKALELLGKVSDVGLFTERTEITVNNRSTVELENNLREKLRRLMGSDSAEDATIVAPPVQVTEPIDVNVALDGL